MKLLEVRSFVENYFGVCLRSRHRVTNNINARATYFKLVRENTGLALKEIGKSVGVNHATVINSLNKFDMYYKHSANVKECYDDALIHFGIKDGVKTKDLENFNLSKPIEKAVKILSEMTDLEVIEFLPRIELYHKSNINKRQTQEQWELQKRKLV